jgi:hypothetical protein
MYLQKVEDQKGSINLLWKCRYGKMRGAKGLVSILPEMMGHLNLFLVFGGVRVTRSLAFCVCFVDRCLPFCTFPFSHCVVCPSIYGFWFPLWFLQTLLCQNEGCKILKYSPYLEHWIVKQKYSLTKSML